MTNQKSPSIIKLIFTLIITLSALARNLDANACSLDISEESPLEWNKVTLSGDTLARVAERIIRAPINFNDQWQIYVIGYAFPNENNARKLAERRKNYAVNILKNVLRVSPEHFSIAESEVYPPSSMHYARGSRADYPAIEISVAPICPPGGCNLCNGDGEQLQKGQLPTQ